MDQQTGDGQAGMEGLFIDLGEQGPRDIADLKDGAGKATREIEAAIDRWRVSQGADTAADVVPVVLLYRQRIAPVAPTVPDDSK